MADLLKIDYYTGYMTYEGKTIKDVTAISEGNVEEWFKKLKEIAENNPEGFTVELLSLSPKIPLGYVVAFSNETLDHWQYRTHIERWWLVADKEKKAYLKHFAKEQPVMPVITIGGWRNPEDGQYYVDVGLIVYDREYAVSLGRKYNQKAIFNLGTFETVNL